MNHFSSYKNIKRYRQIITVLLKYGFDDFISRSDLKRLLPFKKRISNRAKEKKYQSQTQARRLRLALEELGPTFIKLGQILSNRHDLVPKSIIDEFSKLQDHVPEIENFDVEAHLREQLDIDVDKHFSYLDKTPIASASIAQVHKAELIDGTLVAFKILRPGIRETIQSDITILKDIADAVSKNIPYIAEIKPLRLIHFFERTIHRELNFLQEISHIERFKKHFNEDEGIYIPDVFYQYSNSRILCLEFVDGIKITNKEELLKYGVDIKEITRKGTEVYFKMVYEHGFFHADPHPGNLLILRNHKLCFLDFGMMGSILPSDKEVLSDMLIYFIQKDVAKVIQLLKKLSENKDFIEDRELYYDINDLIQEVSSQPLKELKLKNLLEKFRTIVFQYKIFLPSDFFLLIRTFVVMEGLGQQVNPEFNIFKDLKPYIRQLAQKKLSPSSIIDQSQSFLMDVRDLIKYAPSDIKVIIDTLKDGKLTIGFQHKGLENLNRSLQTITNRIALAIITAAMVIGSSLVVLSGIPPLVFNIPILGVVGFTFSLFLGIWTIFKILRKK